MFTIFIVKTLDISLKKGYIIYAKISTLLLQVLKYNRNEGKIVDDSRLTPRKMQILRALVDAHISNGEPGFIYIFSGADVSAEKAEELSARVTEEYPNTDITLVPGGQPVYHYILSVEC